MHQDLLANEGPSKVIEGSVMVCVGVCWCVLMCDVVCSRFCVVGCVIVVVDALAVWCTKTTGKQKRYL